MHEIYRSRTIASDTKAKDKIKYGIAWDDAYLIGYDTVDAQHRKLFVMLSELIEFCMLDLSSAKLSDTIAFLVEYTVRHFEDEEALQLQYCYPDYENHKKMHEEFKVTVAEIMADYVKNGSSAALSESVNKTIVRWLVSHIMGEDKKIGEHIAALKRPYPAASK